MFTTSSNNLLSAPSRLSALFSRFSSPGIDSHSAVPQPSKSPLHAMEDDLSNLKPFPNLRLSSDGVGEVSELFKSTSLGSDSAHDDPLTIASHPIHIRYLSENRPFSGETTPFFSLAPTAPFEHHFNTKAQLHSLNFPRDHYLNSSFVELYQLEDELGSGGYGFVMTARHRLSRKEVAVKFIIRKKVPEHAWTEDELLGRLPTEIVLLSTIKHENVVQFLDLFEDELYFYLVQELHGTPWHKGEEKARKFDSIASTPSLSPSASERSLELSPGPSTPPQAGSCLRNAGKHGSVNCRKPSCFEHAVHFSPPEISQRASHDLFECIEQSDDKRLSESQARYVFAQIVDVVHYLDSRGITHRDIKDENLVIDHNLKVKLIDFGSACITNPKKPRPYYTQFFGTAAYASSEILLKKRYQSAPAEIWTLGVLLSYLLTGTSPFPSVRAAAEGKIVICEPPGVTLSKEGVDLMRRCLDPNPITRIKIQQVKSHPWLIS